MPVPKDDRVYLWDMLTAARVVVDFTRGRTLGEYEADLVAERRQTADRIAAGWTNQAEVHVIPVG